MAFALVVAVLIVCLTLLCGLQLHFEFRREERAQKDAAELSDRLEEELAQIDELKSKVDTLALRAGINSTNVKYTGNTRA